MSQSGNAENPVQPPPKPVRMAAIGSIEQFEAGTSDWPSYAARLDQFIAANEIEDPRKVATLLTVIGSPTFKLLQNLLAPAKPADKTYKELCAALEGHLSLKPLIIAERYRFHKRDQRSGEIIAQYIADLRRLARHCEYGNITKNGPYAWGNFHACAITKFQKPQQLGRARR